MFESIKRLTRHSAVYGISTILGRAIAFLLLPIYTHFLPEAAFGIVNVVFAGLGIMNIVSTLGIESAFLRFYILAESEQEKLRIFNTAFWSILLMAASLLFLGMLFAEFLSNWMFNTTVHENLLRLAVGILFFDALSILNFLLLRAEERSSLYVTLRLANVAVNFTLTYLFIAGLGHGITGVFEANLLSSAFTFLTVQPIALRHLKLTIRRSTLIDLLKFGLPYLPSTLAVYLIDVADRFIIQQLIDLDTVGLYSAGYKLGMVMNLLISAFLFAWHPFFLSTSKEPNAKAIFARVLTLFLLVCASCFLVVSLFINELVRFRIGSYTLLDKAYWNSTSVVPVVMLAYIFYGAYVNFIIGIYLEKKTSYLPFITGIGAIVKIAATYALVPLVGMTGAAWGTVLAFLAMMITLYVITQRLYPIPYEWARVMKLAGATAAFFAVGYWGDFWWWQKAGLVLLYPIILWLTGFFERGELKRMAAVFHNLRAEAMRSSYVERQTSLHDD